MKSLSAAVGALLSGLIFLGVSQFSNTQQEPDVEPEYVFQMDSLKAARAEKDQSYLQFLNVDTMHCGVYHLAAGSEDKQSPHADDEIYYVESGKAKFQYGENETDCAPGTILFVPAKMEHRFHSIEEDITLLVFFARTPKPTSKK